MDTQEDYFETVNNEDSEGSGDDEDDEERIVPKGLFDGDDEAPIDGGGVDLTCHFEECGAPIEDLCSVCKVIQCAQVFVHFLPMYRYGFARITFQCPNTILPRELAARCQVPHKAFLQACRRRIISLRRQL